MVLSGFSDKHIRLSNLGSTLEWSTSSEFDALAAVPLSATPLLDEYSGDENTPLAICQNCVVNVGVVDLTPNRATSNDKLHMSRRCRAHGDLIHNVALGADVVVRSSYDFGVRAWGRNQRVESNFPLLY